MVRHDTPNAAARVAPLQLISPPLSHPPESLLQSMMYELAPATSLPTVDLSISIKSRYLTRRQLNTFDAFLKRFRRPLVIVCSLGVAMYPLTLVLPLAAAEPLAILVASLCTIPSITMFSTLSFDIVTAMLGTFDFWLCTIVSWSTFFVLSAIVGDAPSRSFAVIIALFGVQVNIMVDANLREARNWVWVNSIGVMVHLFIAGWCSFCMIPRQRFFAVFSFSDHLVPSETFVSSGLLTVAALIARNVFRKHRAKLHRRAARKQAQIIPETSSLLPIIEFASYRTMLKFAVKEGTETPDEYARGLQRVSVSFREDVARISSSSAPMQHVNVRGTTDTPSLQKLHHVTSIGLLNARDTMLPMMIAATDCEATPLRMQCAKIFHAFGSMSAISAFLGGITGMSSQSSGRRSLHRSPLVEICSLAAAILYCAPFIALYHRRVLRRIISSFNFAFFSAQVTAAHVCVCDFSGWTTRCVALVATSWVWIHWVLLLDALTPIVRSRIFFHIRLAAPVFVLCVCSALVLIHELITTPSSSADEGYHDRIVWHSVIFGQSITFRVAPFFYNCFVTAFALSLRLLWRLCTVPNDVLVVLDGTIVCNNWMAKKSARHSGLTRTSQERSLRWGSTWRQPPPSQIRVSPARK